jgi:hypothetical protein
LGGFLIFLGVVLLAVGFLLALSAVQALLERLRFGSGLMFADVEIFALGALLGLSLGAGAVWLGRRIRK